MKRVLHLLTGGNPGGIETLCREISKTDLFDNGFVFMTFGGKICEQIAISGVDVYPLFELGDKLSLKKAKELIKIAKLYEFLVIHHEDPYLGAYYCYALKKLQISGVRYVHSCYDDKWLRYKNPVKEIVYNHIMQKTLDLSDRVIFASDAGKISCNNQYIVEESKQKIIYNGVSLKLLEKGSKAIISKKYPSNGTIQLLYIGRLSCIKGVDLIISALPNILKKYDIHLTIVGDGEDRSRLEHMACDLSVAKYISFEGFQTNIEKYLEFADFFLYPSTCKEVFGISIVEAMSYGIPCIATNIGGIPEIIKDNINGFLVQEMTAIGLEKTIKKALKLSSSEYVEISKEARRTAEFFSIRRCQEEFLEVINQIGKQQ